MLLHITKLTLLKIEVLVDEMQVPVDARCPLCTAPMPTNPSRWLKFTLAKYQNAISVYGAAEQVPWHYTGTSQEDLCSAITLGVHEEAIIEEGRFVGWPTSIAWRLLPGQVFALQDTLKE